MGATRGGSTPPLSHSALARPGNRFFHGSQVPARERHHGKGISRRVRIRKMGGAEEEVFPVDEVRERLGTPQARGRKTLLRFQDNGKVASHRGCQETDSQGFETENSQYELEEVPLRVGPALGDTVGFTLEARDRQGKYQRVCRPAKVRIRCADGSTIVGHVNLSCEPDGFDRVSEIFTEGEKPFIVVFNATSRGRGESVLVINKAHIIWASPED